MSAAFKEIVENIAFSSLDANGWTICKAPSLIGRDLQRILPLIAMRLGVRVPSSRGRSDVVELRPTESANARVHSLSRKYSIREFPCHTDTAHWPIPCRYILLACADPGIGSRETVLLDPLELSLTTKHHELLNSTPFRIRNGRNSFFSTVLQKGRPFVRYDPGCMQPLSPNGSLALSYLSRKMWPNLVQRIAWERGDILIIDNWRILHGRGSASCDDTARTLLRLYVNDKNL